MYSISQETKNQLSKNIFEASMIIASIPDEIINKEMREIIDVILYVSKSNISFLDNLKEVEVVDPTEFHQMD
jgi:hypothetical protein